jgi:DNA-binding SARP family transcriptional activator/tetratricopeptide (TPR) repeat protein
MEFKVLGPLGVIGGDGIPIDLPGASLRRLTCFLLAKAEVVVSADSLTDTLELTPGALRVSVSRIRRVLGFATLVSVPSGYQLRADGVDSRDFERLVASATTTDPISQRRFLEDALALWRGDPYGEFVHEEWALVEWRRLTELHTAAVEDLVGLMLENGEWAAVVATLEPLIAAHPLRDRPRGLLMRALAASGRRTDALRAFQDYRTLLIEEIGTEPSSELVTLDRAIASGNVELPPVVSETGQGEGPMVSSERRPAVARGRVTHNLPGTQSPFGVVGRDAELQQIAEAMKRAAADEGRQVVLVSGEAGLGKTTLLTEGARMASDSGACVLFGHCEESLASPYQLFAEALGHYVAYAHQEQLVAAVGAHGLEISRLIPNLATRIGHLSAMRVSDADTERYLLFGAVVGMLARISEHQPVVLVFDDLQWADAGSLQLLGHMARSSQSMRILVLCAFRDTEMAPDHPLVDTLASLRRQEAVARLELTGLDDAGVVSFMEAAAGHALDGPGRGLAHALQRETDGNPFFVGELLRHLSETGAITRDNASGRWVGIDSIEAVPLPDSVREVIGARVGRLGPTAGRVLALASVIGQEFDFDVLATAARISDDDLLDVLDQASAAAVVQEAPASPGLYSFVHDLIGRTLYEEIGLTRRGRDHRRVAEALEALCGKDPGTRVGELAHQWFHARGPRDPSKALHYSRQAADAALVALAPGQALRYFAQALEIYSQMDDPDPKLGIDLTIGLGISQRQSGDPTYRVTLLGAARRAAELGDTERLTDAALSNNRGWYTAAGVIDADKVEMLEMSLDRLPQTSPVRALVVATLCSELSLGSPLERRQALADEALAIAESSEDDAIVVRVLNSVHYALQAPPLLEQSLARTANAIERSERVSDGFLRFLSFHNRHLVAYIAGNMGEMDRCVEMMGSLAETLDQPMLHWTMAYAHATQALIAGDPDRAEALVLAALQLGTDSGQPDTLVTFGLQMMAVRLQKGTLSELIPLIEEMASEVSEAHDVVNAALALAHAEGNRLVEARQLLEDFATAGFDLVLDASWIIGMCGFAEAAIVVGDPKYAHPLFDRLSPWAGQWCTTGITCQGPVSHYVGGLAAVLGRFGEADAYFSQSASMCDRAHARFFAARTDVEWGKMLAERKALGDVDRARALLTQAHATASANGYGNVRQRASAILQSLDQ